MENRRGYRTAVCRDCGTAWSSRSARFCGHCGAALGAADAGADVGADPGADADRRARASSGGTGEHRDDSAGEGPRSPARRRLVGVVLAAGAVVVVAVAAMSGDTLVESDLMAEDPAGVELPDPEDVDEAEVRDEPPVDAGPSASDLAGDRELSCEPEDCELWRLPRGHGLSAIADSVLVTAEPSWMADVEVEEGHEVVRLRGNSITDGAELWESDVVLPAPDRGTTGWSLQGLGGGDLLVTTEHAVSLIEARDGAIRWTVEFDHEAGFVRPLDDGHLYVRYDAADVAPDEADDEDDGRAEAPGSSGAPTLAQPVSAVLDRSTGGLNWSERGRRIVAVVGDLALTTGEGLDGIEARQIATGDVVWSHEVVQDTHQAPQRLGDDRVLITLPDSLQVLDTTDGELVSEVDIDLSGVGDVQVAGDVVVVIEGMPARLHAPEPRSGRLIDLGDPDAEPRTLEGVVQAVPLVPSHGWVDPWSLPDPTGMALTFQDGEGFEIQVLDPDGEVRWSTEGVLDTPTCCVLVHPAGGDDRMIVVPPMGDDGSPQIVSAADGSERGTVELPDDVGRADPPIVLGDLILVRARDEERAVLAGDAGHVTVVDGAPHHVGPPVVVVGGPANVIGIDPALLFGPEVRDARGWYADG